MHRRCCLQAASSVNYATSCKHSLVLLRMGEIIARNMSNWSKLLIKLLLLHLVGCLYYLPRIVTPCSGTAEKIDREVLYLLRHHCIVTFTAVGNVGVMACELQSRGYGKSYYLVPSWLLLLNRRYNSAWVLVRSTIFFHKSLSSTLLFQFLIFIFCKSFLTSSSHLFFGLPIGREANGFHL